MIRFEAISIAAPIPCRQHGTSSIRGVSVRIDFHVVRRGLPPQELRLSVFGTVQDAGVRGVRCAGAGVRALSAGAVLRPGSPEAGLAATQAELQAADPGPGELQYRPQSSE